VAYSEGGKIYHSIERKETEKKEIYCLCTKRTKNR
jgi:hypothetical protein